jgi:hypothetical protein
LHKFLRDLRGLIFSLFAFLFLPSLSAQIILKGDDTWKVFPSYTTGWTSPDFDDSGWGNSTSPSPWVVSPVVPNSSTMWIEPYSDTVYFRKSFFLKSDCVDGPIELSADNEFELYMNDSLVGVGKNLGLTFTFNLAPYLRIGKNTVAIKAVNWNTGPYLMSLYSEVVYTSGPEIFMSSPDSVCPGDNSSFTVLASYPSYNWNTGDTTSRITVDQGGKYWAECTDNNGCLWLDTTELVIYTPQNVELGPDRNICAGDTVQLNTAGFARHLWSTGDTSSQLVIDQSGFYTFDGWDIHDCHSEDSINVFIFDFATISLGDDITTCAGDTVILSAEFPQSSYQWSTGQQGSSIPVARNGTYAVTVTNFCGSVADDIQILFTDLSDFEMESPQFLCPNAYLFLDAGIDFAKYRWSTGSEEKSIPITEAGVYYLDLSDQCGNEVNAEIEVVSELSHEELIPSAFSPNKDGINESFGTLFPSDRYFEISIYDIWGKPVFRSYDPTQWWEGEGAPMGTYTYEIWYSDCLNQFRNKIGNVQLIR